MKIVKKYEVPTGEIYVVEGNRGHLEFISVGDYGKDVNIKADFLDLKRDPDPVRHMKMMPLTEKWVITISTQYGCSMGCTFCDVPKVGSGRNATMPDMIGQILTGITQHPEITSTKRLNIHFARMGEPTWNPRVLDMGKWLHTHLNSEFNVHPVVSTMMPHSNIWLKTFIHNWMRIKNRVYGGNAGLQISINSTKPVERAEMFNGNALQLEDIALIMEGIYPVGRKITLNFAVANWEINPAILLKWFSPELYIIKLTPMHKTATALDHGLKTEGDYTTYYPYKEHEEALVKAGYDVIVFIASVEEDESMITCGNAVLSGREPEHVVWADGSLMTDPEKENMRILARSGCKCDLPLLGTHVDRRYNKGVELEQVLYPRCRLCNTIGREPYVSTR